MPRRASAASISTTRAATLVRVYPYAELREDALAAAHRLIARGVEPGDRVALIAETGARVRRLVLRRALCRRLAGAAAAADLVRRPRSLYRPARRPAEERRSEPCSSIPPELPAWPAPPPRRPASRASTGTSFVAEEADAGAARRRPRPDDIAYLQYSSGSTRFPHGVVDHPPRLAQQSRRPRPSA